MSFVDSKTQTELKISECEPRALEEALGSHYALQVAHQTMKERCQQLQLRLANIEEENLHLRKQKGGLGIVGLNTHNGSKVESGSSSRAQFEQLQGMEQFELLQDKVNQLTHEKAQLIQINSMVATENKKLWSRLSRLTQANQSLGSHLVKISDTLSQHDSNGSIKIESQTTGREVNTILNKESTGSPLLKSQNSNFDTKEQSLEEISLKLINSFLQEKEELEEQYAQMVEMQRDTSFNIHDLGFAYLQDEEEVEDEETVRDITQHCEKLQEMRDILLEQQQVLRNGVEHLNKIKSSAGMCNKCQLEPKQNLYVGKSPDDTSAEDGNVYTSVRFGQSLNDELQQQLSGVVEPPQVTLQSNTSEDTVSLEMESEDLDVNSPKKEDRICPMCGKFYPKRIPFDDFQKHVLHHFMDDSDPVLDNFEVIT